METLKKRIGLIEHKIDPTKNQFDLITHIRHIRTEAERLAALGPEEFELELTKPSNQVSQTARLSAKYARLTKAIEAEADRLLSLPTEQFELEMQKNIGHLTGDSWWIPHQAQLEAYEARQHPPTESDPKKAEEEHQKLTSKTNWISTMLKARQKGG